jgi:hypothetical protein
MADFERTTTVGVDPDAAFAFLSDPLHLPAYVATMTLVESTAIDGDPAAEAGDPHRPDAGEATFLADAATRRIEWGRPGTDYSGAMAIEAGALPATTRITLRLHTGERSDPASIERMIEQTMRNIGRLLSGR